MLLVKQAEFAIRRTDADQLAASADQRRQHRAIGFDVRQRGESHHARTKFVGDDRQQRRPRTDRYEAGWIAITTLLCSLISFWVVPAIS